MFEAPGQALADTMVAFAYCSKGTLAGLNFTPNSRVASALLYTELGCPTGSFPLSISEISDIR